MTNFMLTFSLLFFLLVPVNPSSMEQKPAEEAVNNRQAVTASEGSSLSDKGDDDYTVSETNAPKEIIPASELEYFEIPRVPNPGDPIVFHEVAEDGSVWEVVRRGGEIISQVQISAPTSESLEIGGENCTAKVSPEAEAEDTTPPDVETEAHPELKTEGPAQPDVETGRTRTA